MLIEILASKFETIRSSKALKHDKENMTKALLTHKVKTIRSRNEQKKLSYQLE